MALTGLATQGSAQCLMVAAGAKCAVPPARTTATKSVPPQPVTIGEILPRGKYSMVMNAAWYGLPPVQDGWIYYRIAQEVYRVDYRTMEVLERATPEAGPNWP